MLNAYAAVTPEEAAKLKTELTPLGGERAGNRDGTIPAWTGGYTTQIPGFKNGGQRGDPFASEKPLFSITASNMAQYGDKLTDGTKAMLKKYPQSYRVDVYKTFRTAAAPQWVYDNTFKNATTAKLENEIIKGAFGGIPFPVPKSGREIVANNELHWRGEAWQNDQRGYLVTPKGEAVLSVEALFEFQMPYYSQGEADKFGGEYWMVRYQSSGPPVRAGEGMVARSNMDPNKNAASIYLTGQRRVRKLPNACCDTPTPSSSGVATFDEIEVLQGRAERFEWKIIGKKEVYIPYNSNRMHTPTKDSDLLMANHLNPQHVRWELHRVWVVEANLKAGQRHMAPRSLYYMDEDTWVAVLGDRWDASGQLWKTLWSNPVVMPDLPATTPQQQWGFKDLQSGTWYASVVNERPQHYKIVPRRPDSYFSAQALAGEGVR
jgi:hypothetical protein